MKVDLLINDVRALTLDPAAPTTDRIAVHNGRIVAVGEDCRGLTGVRTVNAQGATLTPGFNDAHAHSVWFGTTLLEVDLSGASGLDDVYERIDRRARTLGEAEWVVASGYNQMDTGGHYPDAEALDRASGGRPVWIKHTSGHSCIVSARAMRILGVTGTESFDGGSVVVDEDGRPTGRLEETAMSLVQDYMLPLSNEDIVEALTAAHRVYVTEGITSVTDAGIAGGWIGHSPVELGAYQAALEAGGLQARTQAMIASDVLERIAVGDSPHQGLPTGIRTGFGDEWLSVGPVKIFLDGSILGNTAKMSGGYDNCPSNHGYFQGDVDQMTADAIGAARAGWSLAMHAVGDEAIDVAIDILSQIRDISPRMPHRIEHGGVVTPDQLQALADLGATIVSQPHFMQVYGDGFRSYIGDERAQWSYRCASQLRAGLPLAGSSDRPVADGAPLKVMGTSIDRRTPSGWVYGPDERLTRQEALEAYTVGSAKVTGWAGHKGVLAPGMLADLVVLSGDPIEQDPRSLDVLGTVIGGRVAHDATGVLGGEEESWPT